VTPQFQITVPARTSSVGRKPEFVSPTVDNVTITLNTVDGNPPTVTPTSKNSPLTPPCAPCTVAGPPSPPGVDSFTVTTFHGAVALDTNSITFTVIAGSANTGHAITLQGIPKTVVLGALAAKPAGATNTQTLSVTVKDADGNTITGTYSQPITITDPDTATYGASVKGTTVSGGDHAGSCTTTCVVVLTSSDPAVSFNYTGLAEEAVTVASSGTGVTSAGTSTFTPTLGAITAPVAPVSALGGIGIDLYTTDSGSPVGYSGIASYSEAGYTESPYLKTLTTINGSSCAAFATLAATNNANKTDFTATAIASPAAGSCTRVVSDGLTPAGHGSGGPSFVVTYTTSSVSADGKKRQH
jgi:hypothetical protein